MDDYLKDLNDIEREKSELIAKISRQCKTRYGELLVEFMDEYDLSSLAVATVDQLSSFVEKLENEKQKQEKEENNLDIQSKKEKKTKKKTNFLKDKIIEK